ncbi:HNH endonuclease [Cytobacillus pseudoceanisediminis]|uniref:HNH endonuclease n=1 Tax=Cytobacillus pseudoceanisediminis TaxID=3051614 RepID=UPI003CF6B8F7
MIKLEFPGLNYQNILIKCVEGIEDKDLQRNVYNNITNFLKRAENYKELANIGKLFNIDGDLKDNFSYKQMIFLYGKLRDSKHARIYYDYLLGTSIECPYCGIQLSASIDHYLPKKHYPMYSIDPVNLVPCCSDCNSKKSEHKQLEGEETFHPYFDKMSEHQFLFAKTEEVEGNVAFKYYLQKPVDLSDEQFIKLENHFEKLELEEFYSILASKEIHTQIYELKKLYDKGGGEEVANCLEDIYLTNLNTAINSWKTALYEGLRNDTWFCNNGIKLFEYVTTNRDESLVDEETIEIPS